ncbi:gamma-type small acid-soluble spore protein [Bacillus sp. B6(2022)]|nr:gamma-type small acid-soluble spore protein [Bacillus sp. B6(2022)]
MDKQQNKTNAQQVKKQNQAAAQGGQYGTEFASETDAQHVKNTTKKLSKTNNKTANH